ncbi:MAG TPA: SDR family oxidoreductase [Propionibacteriaceae bacterium]|nr:SDR family oxidoreductase [Propionibacteriaceae bacterium]
MRVASASRIAASNANVLRVRAASLAWGDRGARVNSLSPGIIMTPLARDELSGPGAEGCQMIIAASVAKRVGTPDEVAEAAAFLRGAQFITGTDLLIDGGVIASRFAGRLSVG